MLKNTYLEREAMQAALALIYLLFINGEEGGRRGGGEDRLKNRYNKWEGEKKYICIYISGLNRQKDY